VIPQAAQSPRGYASGASLYQGSRAAENAMSLGLINVWVACVERASGVRARDTSGEVRTIRILIVDDHKPFVEAVQVALETAGVSVVDVVSQGSETLEAVHRSEPDVILMDIGPPDENGLIVGRRVLQRHPNAKIVAITALADRSVLDEALHIGFVGYLTKDTPVRKFVSALRAASDGHLVMQRLSRQQDEAWLLASQLTPREREILALVALGANNKVAAARLGVSQNTIRSHVHNILNKLQMHSRLEAGTFAVRHRLVDVTEPNDRRIA
jgi:two-component system nitrate/nitrite response regulator NarL